MNWSGSGESWGRDDVKPDWLRRAGKSAKCRQSVNAKILLAALCLWISVGVAAAQSNVGELSRDIPSIDEELEKATADRSGNFVAVPIPFSNPALGTGLAAVAAYMFRLDSEDTEVPASFTWIGGLYSDTESWGLGVAQKLYLKGDRIRIAFAVATAELNYKFYGIGNSAGDLGRSIALSQSGDVVGAKFEYRVAGDYFVGFRLGAAEIETSTELAILPPEFDSIPLVGDGRLEDLGLLLRRDTRDHVYTPGEGSLLELDLGFRRHEGRVANEYRKVRFGYNRYLQLQKAILAYRLYACYAGQGSPFYDLCAFGSNNDLRGYTAGRYQDRTEVATQVEYRRPLRGRWGFVAFGGVGTVAPSFSEMNADDLLPSVGAGVRFMISEAQRVNLRVDVARGNDETTVHINVGEAF